jgi:hypothetical protein
MKGVHYLTLLSVLSMCLIPACSDVGSKSTPTPTIKSVTATPDPVATGTLYKSPYPEIPMTGSGLSPQQIKVADAVARFEYISKILWERRSSNFDALKEVASPNWAKFMASEIQNQLKSQTKSSGWETINIRFIKISNTSAIFSSCSSERTLNLINGEKDNKYFPVRLRTVYALKVANRWVVSQNFAMPELTTVQHPPEVDNDALLECRAYFGQS